jgi:Na+/H+-dicarboxylate symporter/ABC-type amino acid transport substrate-binding protein
LKSGAPLFLLAWVVVFVTLFVFAQAIPVARPPVVVEAGGGQSLTDLVSLLIPANPFTDLTRNYVPAIVVFCAFFGVAIQRAEKKQSLLEALDAFRRASITIWGWVVGIAPFGVFALFAALAGTIRLDLLGSLVLYGVLFIFAALVLALWVLPSLLSALAPVDYRDLMKDLQEALVVAVITSLPIAAVPIIIRVAQALVERQRVADTERNDVISTTMAVSYPLAQLGNLFVILFVVFAAFYVHSALPGSAWVSLPLVTVLSTVGTPVSTVNAVQFIAKYLAMPADIKLLYVEMMTLTRYPQVLVSAMGLAFVTILSTCAYYGLLKVRTGRLGLSLAVSAVLIGLLTFAGRAVQPLLTEQQSNPYLHFTLGADLVASVKVTDRRDVKSWAAQQGSAPTVTGPTMARIEESGTLRVGYGPNIIPFSYDNQAGDLVGYDIAYVYALARDLGVTLELYPITDWRGMIGALKAERFDLAVGGLFVTPKRLQEVAVSNTYLETPPALIVHAADAKKFANWDGEAASEGLKIVAFNDPIIIGMAKRLFPKEPLRIVGSYGVLSMDTHFDAAVWTLEQAKAWAEAHDGYSVAVPKNAGAPLSIAFLMPPNSIVFRRFVDDWLALQGSNGFQSAINAHWLEGKPRRSNRPRWSILRNVLGWRN